MSIKETTSFSCRALCAACCIAPSITSPIPGMEKGKPAGIACIQLDSEYKCKLFGLAERPSFCASFKASQETCGYSRTEALRYLEELEELTR